MHRFDAWLAVRGTALHLAYAWSQQRGQLTLDLLLTAVHGCRHLLTAQQPKAYA